MKWRGIPMALKCAIILQFVQLGSWLVFFASDSYKYSTRIFLAQSGVGFVIKVTGTIGTFDLARTLTGRARIGSWIAFAGFIGGLALTLAWTVIECKQSWTTHESLFKVLDNIRFANTVLIIGGLALATNSLAIAIGPLILGIASQPPTFIHVHIEEALEGSGRLTIGIVRVSMELVYTVCLLVLAGYAARDEMDTADNRRAIAGFRGAARAMWIRVFAVGVVPLLTLLAAAGHSKDGADLVKFAMIASIVVGLWSLTQFALGALGAARSRIPDLSRGTLLASAMGSLWCAGLALAQAPRIYNMLYGGRDSELSFNREFVEAWAVVGPIVAIIAIALMVGAIAGFAGRRALNDLHTQASTKGVAFVILMFTTVALQQWVLPKTETAGNAIFILLCALAAGLAGTVMMANLCTLAAESVESEPTLPTATLR